MEDKVVENSPPSTARIFVGGLGESVTADELRRVFQLCGGVVDSLDFVRTKGRSFAYVDFSPSSNTSLSILFAKYNGCVWKGGKLRLEKAKEHYLNRLARESAQSEANDDDHRIATPASSEVVRDENIRIFFPRLRKVKVLPLSGTGKHKYSFQRIEVPSLPKYFCGCEQHSGYSEKSKQIHRDQNGMDPDEVNIMNKVMNALFQKQNYHLAGDESLKSIGEKDEAEEDDLLINVVGNNKLASSERQHIPQISHIQAKKESLERKQKREWSQDASPMQKREPPSKKKKKQVSGDHASENEFKSAISANNANFDRHSEESNKVERAGPHSNAQVSWSQKSSWKELLGDSSSNTFCLEVEEKSDAADGPEYDNQEENLERDKIDAIGKDEAAEGPDNKGENEKLVSESFKQKTEGLIEAQSAEPNKVSSQRQGALWMQKYSWTELLGQNSSFSLSGTTSSDNEKLNGIGNPDSAVVTKPGDESMKDVVSVVTGNNESCKWVVEGNCSLAVKQMSPVKLAISETCTFMRSEKSLKEWAKTKAALSGSLKRKGNRK